IRHDSEATLAPRTAAAGRHFSLRGHHVGGILAMKFTIWLALCAVLCWGASGCQDNRGPAAGNKQDSSNPNGDMGKFKFSQESFGKLTGGGEGTEFKITTPSGRTLKWI